jgi:hypothetical protein
VRAHVVLICVALCAAGFVLLPVARADGDPASDFLIQTDTYTGVQAPPSNRATLDRAVAKAFARGYRLKVAVVATPVDLGSIPSLFNRPAQYAKFLGLELRSLYAGPLLIVMPRGFGIYDAGRSTKREAAVLAKLKVRGKSVTALTSSATEAATALTRGGALRSPDILAPSAYPQFASAKAGATITLAYRVLEDSERSSETITVYSSDTKLAQFHHALARATFSAQRSFEWTVPEPLPENLRWCVVSKDPAGNSGKPACLAILPAK